MGPQDGLLAIDRNSNGVIDGLSDLFGNATTDGFIVLKGIDSNNDDLINSSDTEFGNLRVWVDANSDGVAQTSEVNTLAHHGITGIALNKTTTNQFVDGTLIAETAGVTKAGGNTTISSVYFARETLLSEWTVPGNFTISTDAGKLPGLKGYGDVKNIDAAMTFDSTLLNMVQDMVDDAEVMTSAQLRTAFENILYRWADVEGVSATGRGSYIDGKHLAVVEKFYGAQFTQEVGNSVVHDPGFVAAAELEKIYANMLGSMLLQFMGQVAISQAVLADDEEALTDSIFWPLALLGDGSETGLSAAVSLVNENAPVDGTRDTYFEKLVGVMAKGAAVHIYDGDSGAAKAGFAEILDPVSARWLGAVLDGNGSIAGSDAGEYVYGTAAEDILLGLDGNDVLYGEGGDDIIIGGAGNDELDGRWGGDDTYIYRVGDGYDVIWEDYLWAGGNDRAVFGEGLNLDDLIIVRDNGVLTLGFAGNTGSLTVFGMGGPADKGIESFTFGDGQSLSQSDLYQHHIRSLEASNSVVIEGYGTNDEIYGNAADNYIAGYGGDDIYHFGPGIGDDVIDEGYMWCGGGDQVVFGEGMNAVNLHIARYYGDLILSFDGYNGDSLYLYSMDAYADRGVEQFTFGDDEVWSREDMFAAYITQEQAVSATEIHGFELSNDVIASGSADNALYGYGGNDILNGGNGNDVLRGGWGADIFAFDAAGNGVDVVVDFEKGYDLIDLRAMGITFGDLTFTVVGSDARIVKIGSVDLDVTLTGINPASMDSSDFLFT